MTSFAWRGVVEGFYGKPWDPADRRWLVERMGAWGMNAYVYAPKDDPLQRQRWREPYPEAQQREFRSLVAAGRAAGVEVAFALSPGLSIRYSARADLDVLVAKFRSLLELGARCVSLGLDDVPSRLVHAEDREAFASLAAAHVALSHELQRALGSGVRLWLVPTDYLGTEPSEYLETLGRELDPAIEVGWTGRTVVSPEIRTHEAHARARTLQRRLLVWDNVPVSDGPMRGMLHLGPYGRRDPDLASAVSGILLNPMEHARASAVMLYTAAEYLRDPQGYDPEAAWPRALAEVGRGAEAAFARFARAQRFSPVWPEDRDRELEDALRSLGRRIEAGEAAGDALERARDLLALRLEASPRLRSDLADRRLLAEIEPWLAAHERETRVMQSAVRTLAALTAEGPRGSATRALFAHELRVSAEPIPAHTSYGPRRALYPQFVSLREDEMGFGPDPWLFRDRCLADETNRLVERAALRALALTNESEGDA